MLLDVLSCVIMQDFLYNIHDFINSPFLCLGFGSVYLLYMRT